MGDGTTGGGQTKGWDAAGTTGGQGGATNRTPEWPHCRRQAVRGTSDETARRQGGERAGQQRTGDLWAGRVGGAGVILGLCWGRGGCMVGA